VCVSTPLGRELGAIAQGLRRGRSPISPKSVHGHPFQGLRPRKACMEKGANKLLDKDVHPGYAEGKALGVGRGLCPILAYPLVGSLGR